MYQLITNCQGKSCIRLSGKDLPQRRRGRGEKPGGEGGKGGKGSRGGEDNAGRVKISAEMVIAAAGRQSGGVPPQSKVLSSGVWEEIDTGAKETTRLTSGAEAPN
jgi:hypothetical protein